MVEMALKPLGKSLVLESTGMSLVESLVESLEDSLVESLVW